MIGIVVATHAQLGKGLLDAISLIAGSQPQTKAIGLEHGDGIDEFKEKVFSSIEEMNTGDGVLCFVDFIGGTPANTMMQYMQEKELHCIVGANLSMILEAVMDRDYLSLQELENACLKAGKESIATIQEIYERTKQNEDCEEF